MIWLLPRIVQERLLYLYESQNSLTDDEISGTTARIAIKLGTQLDAH